MAFLQDPPRLDNQYDHDPLLKEYLARTLPPEVLASAVEEYRYLGDQAAGPLYRLMLEDLDHEPRLVQWDPWGRRIDLIELTPVWAKAKELTAEHGLVGAAYEQKQGPYSRVHQFALNYLVQASLDVYSCPLAMTDGAARTLLDLGNRALSDRAVPRLISRDPANAWTSGQWMTERTGGSDVGLTETVARQVDGGWTLDGVKWFTSATTSEMALTLGRPVGNPEGGRGLALFYVETRRADGTPNGISVHRLKDKLGTRKVPTAELSLAGTLATPVAGLTDGVRNISSMLNVTRTWNAVAATWLMRRAIALCQDYARRRIAFGRPLSEKPLHLDTLAQIAAEAEGAFHLTFRVVELMGKKEAGLATPAEELLLRVITPLAKLTTGKQAAAVTSEAIEAFGGAGYVEDTGLPRLLADAQVLPIWEGTTNVLSLDTLRALEKEGVAPALFEELEGRLVRLEGGRFFEEVKAVRQAIKSAQEWWGSVARDRDGLEAGARRFALTLGRSLELTYLIDHAAWCCERGDAPRAQAAARIFARRGVELIDRRLAFADARALALGTV
ncbi:MAG: acyl-CoA dehydrogenase family protein [Deltaproteobacteria bacterium]|nr:acyl-CoA dehydrogenase family protein [Deltaproteobacteria bacterium]